MKLWNALRSSRVALLLTPFVLASLVEAQVGQPRQNAVIDAFENAGTIGYLIVLVSVVALGLIIENFVTIKRERLAPATLVDELEALFDEENFQDALELCENEANYLAKVVAAGLGKLGHSFETIQTALRETEEAEAVKLFQKISYLSLITASAPMLGLLGTVSGMFVTFGEIAAAGGSESPARLADGIKMALVTTIFGLIVAIPVGAFYFLFRNRVVRSSIEVNAVAEDLFERFRDAPAARATAVP